MAAEPTLPETIISAVAGESIDGYGLRLQHLNDDGRAFLTVAILRRIEARMDFIQAQTLTPEQRQAIFASYQAAKGKLDASQQKLLDAITTPPVAG